jgi:hypothetical protein
MLNASSGVRARIRVERADVSPAWKAVRTRRPECREATADASREHAAADIGMIGHIGTAPAEQDGSICLDSGGVPDHSLTITSRTPDLHHRL